MRLTLACLALLLLAGCERRPKPASADSAAGPAKLQTATATGAGAAVGQWVGELPAADSPSRRFTLTLGDDFTAQMRTEYEGKGELMEKGTWSADGKAVTVMINDRSGKPVSAFLAYDLLDAELVPSAGWDSTAWGTVGPPRLARR